MFKAMANYNPFGSNHQEFKTYQKMQFLKKNLDSLEDDKVEEYDLVMSKLYKWVSYAIELRCDDVVARRDAIELLKKEREDAIAADSERTAKKEAELEAKQKVRNHSFAIDQLYLNRNTKRRSILSLLKLRKKTKTVKMVKKPPPNLSLQRDLPSHNKNSTSNLKPTTLPLKSLRK